MTEPAPTPASSPDRTPLRELAWLFARLGATAFGGPAVHVSLMEEEVVRRRGWLTRERFLDLLGAANLIPGPNSTELAIHIGHDRAGWRGLIVAGACFIAPATLIVMALGWIYVRWGTLPEAAALLYGVKPVIIAAVVHALWGLARTSLVPPSGIATRSPRRTSAMRTVPRSVHTSVSGPRHLSHINGFQNLKPACSASGLATNMVSGSQNR
jgi:chromate transporter